VRNWDNHLCAFHGYLPSHGRKTQNNKVCLTFCFNRGWRYGTCGCHNSGKNCIHNPTFEPRKLVTGDVRKGCKLVLAVSFVTSPLPAHWKAFPKPLQLKSVLESWYTSQFQTHRSTTVVFLHGKSNQFGCATILWWPWCTSNLCRSPFIRKSFLNGSHHGEPAPNYPHLAPAKAASEKKTPGSHWLIININNRKKGANQSYLIPLNHKAV